LLNRGELGRPASNSVVLGEDDPVVPTGKSDPLFVAHVLSSFFAVH
jgi:hypothetical protein